MSVPLSTTEVLEEEAAYLRSAASADCRDARTAPAESSPPLCALCISGGGIRSATFALGALQGLAGSGLLERFDYLSTVSGGGYIGSWLTAWIHRAKGIGKVMPCLKPGGKPPKDFDPIQHLREYNNYLSPRVNITSADTWTLASTVIRNMFLNWLVLIPLLMVMLMAPRLIMSLGRLGETFDDFYGAPFPPELSAVLPLVGGFLLAMAVYNTMRYLPGIGNYQHTEADFVKFCLAPAILAALTYMTFDAWFYLDLTKLSGGAAGTHTPVLTYLMAWMIGASLTGWAAYIIRHGGSGRLKLMFSPVSLALILMGAALGGSEYVLSKYILPHVPWNPYITTAAPMLLGAFGMAAFLFVGFSSRYLKDEDREWLSRAGAWLLMFVFGWMAICSLVLNLPEVELKAGHLWQGAAAAFGGGAGWLSALGGFKARARAGVGDGKAGISAADVVAKLAAPAFVVLLLIGLAILTDTVLWYGTAFLPATGMAAVWQPKHRPAGWSQHGLLIASARWELVVAATAVFWAVAWVMARRININMFSLHGMYRSRLIRAYLGASKAVRAGRSLTGFDERDNLYMYELQDPKLRPFYVVNVTLNLVAGQRLAWQQRKAAPFTISALHCGSADLGYRPSREYGGKDGISLGTAVTISGAAASPNMGYHSSAVVAFIMTLFNARLGAWLGNPGTAGDETWREAGPTSATRSLLREALGSTNDSSEYVYLSDGGHFENLGLYEMIRRRCRCILVLDSGCDPEITFEDLANAMRKIRIDFGVTIDFGGQFAALKGRTRRCALGVIRYSEMDAEAADGYLVYVKPVMCGNEPPDVASYQSAHHAFPHESTGNQWFNESQTESYRMLGLHTIEEICEGWESSSGFEGFIAHIRDRYLAVPAAKAAGA